MDQPHLKHPHVFAVVRYDLPVNPREPQSSVSVVKAFMNRVDAEAEAARLRTINDGSKCLYEVHATRLVYTSEK